MIRFYNARVLTMAEGNKIEFGEVWTEEDKILYAGNLQGVDAIAKEIGKEDMTFAREIDCQQNVLMPGCRSPVRIQFPRTVPLPAAVQLCCH